MKDTFIGFAKFAFLVTLLFVTLSITGHCAISAKHDNAFGAVSYTVNPYTYVAGSVVGGVFVGDGKGVVIRVQPLGTYQLYTQDILFCSDGVLEALDGKQNPVVITYRVQASRAIDGIGCHQLFRIDEIVNNSITK